MSQENPTASMKAIIIDDVPQARKSLKADLDTYCPDIEVIGEADGVVSGAKLLREKKPDVLFLDIHLNDGTGFDILEILGGVDYGVIFTTASDEHAIRAFRFSAIDYLLKPVDPDELVEAVAKAKQSIGTEQAQVETLLETVKKKDQPLTRLALNTLEKIHVVQLPDIVRLESSANYTIFHFKDKRQLLVTKTLKEYDQLLNNYGFIRVHQSHLINRQMIKEFVKIDGGYLVMTDGTEVPVSSRKRASVMQMISDL
ncbi:MAG: LytTR family DNA-binding domain-containing protein [Bacteroidota bacterium]